MPVTAAAYAQALVGETPTPWGPVAGLGADAFTANPLLGLDALEPLVAAAAEAPAPASSPWSAPATPAPPTSRTCRPPSGRCTSGSPALVDGLSERLLGECGLSGMGAVVGATEPEHIARLRELMPRSIFLIPGVGAQGGQPELLGAAFAAGRAVGPGRRLARDRRRPDPAAAAERLRAAVWDISTA